MDVPSPTVKGEMMPGPSPQALIWSEAQQHYELATDGQPVLCFQRGNEPAWQQWLAEQTSFAFVGQAGRLSVLKEARSRGAGYWYAYRTQDRHTHKRYLGPTSRVTFARLEAAAAELSAMHSSAPVRPPQEELACSVPTAENRREEFWSNVSHQEEQRVMQLSPKLSRPRLPPALVERSRLLSELDAVRSSPLTLVSASAGSGKTTLLSAWAAHFSPSQEGLETMGSAERKRAAPVVAWLALDALDNDPVRFWSSVIAALQTCLPQSGHSAFALLHSSKSPPLSTILMTFLHDLMEEDSDIILILDDYHVISDQAICDSMRFLLEHLPERLHLVLATRTDPELPLARLRVRSHLLEIRDRDLRFTEDEAASFLTQTMGLPLSAEQVAALTARTEGWIAGLQLASLALRQREDLSAAVADFGGSHRYLLDYVQQDILTRLPVPLQDFLLQTSVLASMNADFCQAVTVNLRREECQQILEELERANLFVVPLDDERQWYRYHDLFREALLARLQARQPELVPLLHLRAARLYEAQGEWAEAIAHWFEAKDFSAAAHLMEQTVEQFWVRGEAATMARWVLALPEPLVRKHARLLLTTALYLLAMGFNTSQEQRERRHQEVRRLMARVEMALRPQKSATEADAGTAFSSEDVEALAAEDALLRRRLRLLHMYLIFNEVGASGDFERLSGMQQEIEEELDQDDEIIWQMVPLACSFMLHYTVRREGASLVPQLLSAKARASESTSPFATIALWELLALAAVRAGQLRLAYEESQVARTLIEQLAGYALLKGYFEIAQIEALYQWNRLEEARDLLRTVVHDAAAWQQLDLLGWAYADLMQVELARGACSAAEQALYEVEQLVQRERFGTYPGWLPALRADFWLAQGRLGEASGWAAGVVFSEGQWDPGSYSAFPVVMRVYFAEGRWTEALDLLERWSGHLDRPANIENTITYLSQLLVALHQTGQRDQARLLAARLFALTEPEGYLRVYLDEGESMRQVLLAWLTSHNGQHPQISSTMTYISRVLAAFEQEERQPPPGKEAWPATTHKALSRRSQAVDLPVALEPLSPQEQRVLRLLVAGQTYPEMAQTLVVSPNTIKTHVSRIYRKLGVSRRAEAIAVTGRLHLLSSSQH